MSGHLKAYAAPKSWTLLRKVNKWVVRPFPGKHPLNLSVAVGLMLKQLGCGQTTKEIRKIVNSQAVLVDGRLVKDLHFSIGFMDTLHVKPNVSMRCSLDEKGRLNFISVPESELSKKICKITGKKAVKGGKIQLNLSDGRNILAEKGKYSIGDSLLLEIPSQKITEQFQMVKGNTAFLIGGGHIGKVVTITDIQGERIWCTKGKEKIETLKKFALVVGKDKSTVKI